MLKLSSIKANLEKQYQAEWVDFPAWPGVRFNVCSVRLPAYHDAKDAAAKKLAKKYKGGKIPDDELRAIDGALLCSHLLHGWDGIDQEYSPEQAEVLLCDLEFSALYDAAMWCAISRASVDAEYVEDVIKN